MGFGVFWGLGCWGFRGLRFRGLGSIQGLTGGK